MEDVNETKTINKNNKPKRPERSEVRPLRVNGEAGPKGAKPKMGEAYF